MHCSALQCVAVRGSVLQDAAACCNVLQAATMCCRVPQHRNATVLPSKCYSIATLNARVRGAITRVEKTRHETIRCSVAVCYSVLQCATVCCSVLTACCSVSEARLGETCSIEDIIYIQILTHTRKYTMTHVRT